MSYHDKILSNLNTEDTSTQGRLCKESVDKITFSCETHSLLKPGTKLEATHSGSIQYSPRRTGQSMKVRKINKRLPNQKGQNKRPALQISQFSM